MTNRQWLLRTLINLLGLNPDHKDPHRINKSITKEFMKRLEQDAKLSMESMLEAYMTNMEKKMYKFKVTLEVINDYIAVGLESIAPGGEDWLDLKSHLDKDE